MLGSDTPPGGDGSGTGTGVGVELGSGVGTGTVLPGTVLPSGGAGGAGDVGTVFAGVLVGARGGSPVGLVAGNGAGTGITGVDGTTGDVLLGGGDVLPGGVDGTSGFDGITCGGSPFEGGVLPVEVPAAGGGNEGTVG